MSEQATLEGWGEKTAKYQIELRGKTFLGVGEGKALTIYD